MLSYISPSSSAAPSPRSCASPMPLGHKMNNLTIGSPLALSPRSSPQFRGVVHPVTPPPFALATDKTSGASKSTGVKEQHGAGTAGPTSMPRQYSTTGVSLATSTIGKPHLVGTGGGVSGFGTFDYESEGSTFPAKRMSTVHEALKELHEILMGDVESSESSESDSDEEGGEFEMEMEDEEERKEAGDKFASGPAVAGTGVGIRSGRRASMIAAEQARPASVVSTSASTSTSLKEKPSKGWRKGVARESVRFQLMVDVPCWEPGCYSDLSSMQALRDKTLKALHNLIDSLHLRGIRTTYRLHSTANGGAWGCIRVAPFMSSRLGPNASSYHHMRSPLSYSPVTPSSLLMNASRRMTVAGSLPTSSSTSFGAGPARSKTALLDQREMDEKEQVAERVKKALEADGEGIVEENRTYLLAVNGQPALVLT